MLTGRRVIDFLVVVFFTSFLVRLFLVFLNCEDENTNISNPRLYN